MLRFAKRVAVVVSVTMLACAPVAIADTAPPAKPIKVSGVTGESKDPVLSSEIIISSF
jgi:hypothetical protein